MKLKDMLLLVTPKTRVHVILDEYFNIVGLRDELFLHTPIVDGNFYVYCVYIKNKTLYIETTRK